MRRAILFLFLFAIPIAARAQGNPGNPYLGTVTAVSTPPVGVTADPYLGTVDFINGMPSGLLSARPSSNCALGQAYYAIDNATLYISSTSPTCTWNSLTAGASGTVNVNGGTSSTAGTTSLNFNNAGGSSKYFGFRADTSTNPKLVLDVNDSTDSNVKSFRLGWLNAADVAAEPTPSYLAQGPLFQMYGPLGSYMRISKYPYGWAHRYDQGSDPTLALAEFYVPKYFSIAPSLAGTDPRLDIRDRNDSVSVGIRMQRAATNAGGYAEIGVDNEEGSTTVLYPLGLKFHSNKSDGTLVTSMQIEHDGKVRIGGTTSNTPLRPLHVFGENGLDSIATFSSFDSTSNNPAWLLINNGAGADILRWGANSGTGESWWGSYGAFHIHPGSTDLSDTSFETANFPPGGGLKLLTKTQPTCDAAHRGTTFYVAGGAGVKDTYNVCTKNAADTYAWAVIY